MTMRRTPMPRRCAFSARTPCAARLTARLWSRPPGAWSPTRRGKAFDRALTEQPGQPQARYYVALAAEQDGKKADAIRDYQSLLAEFAARRALAERGERAVGGAQGRAGPGGGRRRHSRGAAADDRGHGVQLATRLASNGGSVDEWSRLIRAYTVLHEADKAKAALVDARKALASDANAVASLDALARNLGLGDAN